MSARPGRVKDIFDVPFRRPRTLQLKREPRFLEIEDKIWKLIEEESDNILTASAEDPYDPSAGPGDTAVTEGFLGN